MTERRKYTGKERRGRDGKGFTTAEEILKKKKLVADKLAQYEMDAGVGIKSFFVHAVAVIGVIVAFAGMHFDSETVLWTGVTGTLAAVTLGEAWIRKAKKMAASNSRRTQVGI